MTLYKDTRIDNFFKPFAQSSHKKRPLPEDVPIPPPAKRKSPMGSPQHSQIAAENETVETLGVIEKPPSHKPSKQQPIPSIDEPSELEPTMSIAISDGMTAPGTSVNTVPIHPPSDTASYTLATPSSQSLSTSSQRVVRNGEVKIRDSDEESGSDASLQDLDELLALFKPSRNSSCPLEPELSHPREADDTGGSSSKRMTRGRPTTMKTASPLCSALPIVPKTYKISLESLAKHRRQYDASNAGIAQAKSVLDLYDKRKATAGGKGRVTEKKGALEADLINVVMKNHGDEDDIGRLKTAIHRTEALQHGKSWSFFEDYPEEFSPQQADFPILGNDHRLKPILREASSRQQAFLSGYVEEYAQTETLPDEIMLWLMDAVCLEPRDDLRHSYTATLNATDELYSLLTPERIDMLFRRLGATATAIDVEQEIIPRAVMSQSTDIDPRPSLMSVLELFGRAASGLESDSRIHLFCTMCRLSLDNTIATNCNAIRAIEDVFAILIDSIGERYLQDEMTIILNSVYKTITDASLRLQLLQSIPALPPRLILLRRRLALAFFFQDARLLREQSEESINLEIVAQHLQDPQFTINNATDYAEVAATIGILSIGIDCSDPPSQPHTKHEETAFNKHVDNLSLKIKAMFTQINDTGASHMKRTEAKETLEAFHSRLLYAVRTKPPPKRNMFGDSQARSIPEMFKAHDVSKQDDAMLIANGI